MYMSADPLACTACLQSLAACTFMTEVVSSRDMSSLPRTINDHLLKIEISIHDSARSCMCL